MEIYGSGQAHVTIAGKSYRLVRKPHAIMSQNYDALDGSRLRGTTDLIEWRWPNGSKVTCLRV